jgi:hypothetical protein
MKLLAFAACASVGSARIFSTETESAFAAFKSKFNRVYENEEKELSALAAFANNLVRAEHLNRFGGATHGITKFMDLTPEEFKNQYLNYSPSPSPENRVVQSAKTLPAAALSVDWSNSTGVKFITPVKDQGRCGSCWAFSTVEQIETVYAMNTHSNAIPFSTQQVVACDKQSLGCNGGDTVSGFEYIRQFGGIESAVSYPDTSSRAGITGRCLALNENVVPGTQVDETIFCLDECVRGACNKSEQDKQKAMQCITAAPQSICVNANAWQTYQGGVLTDGECGSHGAFALDHCVQVVGYNTEAEVPYYIVRNSWAEGWGYKGMIHIAMEGNACGILDEMTTVTLK